MWSGLWADVSSQNDQTPAISNQPSGWNSTQEATTGLESQPESSSQTLQPASPEAETAPAAPTEKKSKKNQKKDAEEERQGMWGGLWADAAPQHDQTGTV